jgi:FKBP-type peptidyl-prolyl cis-trans isomerase FkpA
MYRLILAAVLAAVCSAAATAQPALESDQDKTLYALGVAIGTNVQEFALTPAELAVVEAGIDDAVAGNDSRVDMQVYGPKIQQLADARASAAATQEKQASSAFLAQMAKEDGAEQTESGLVYIPIAAGTGASPTATDTVRVHYHGTLRDGTVFDSSVQRGEPVSLALNQVIPCWTEGLQMMKVGGKSKLVCPSDLAYGDSGQGPIPGGAALVFEIQLLGIE